MKPDWKDAPEWANWLAMDDDDCWFWYENKPYLIKDAADGFKWMPNAPNQVEIAGRGITSDVVAKSSLEQRPQPTELATIGEGVTATMLPCDHPNERASLLSRAAAWDAVWQLLSELDSELESRATTGRECALASIRQLATTVTFGNSVDTATDKLVAEINVARERIAGVAK